MLVQHEQSVEIPGVDGAVEQDTLAELGRDSLQIVCLQILDDVLWRDVDDLDVVVDVTSLLRRDPYRQKD
ncbi:hypothetical protein [Methylobacterium tarhaniae]|uniref:hypothetical protein n=1 Tax=Methylobacterium tarhaniae TaxID=1187852 RepID=UPI003D02B53A